MQNDLLYNLNQLLVYLGNQLLILFLLLLIAENEHFLHRGQIDLVTAFTVKPDPLANHDDFGILGVLGNNYIVIENFGPLLCCPIPTPLLILNTCFSSSLSIIAACVDYT
ncbi:hypothetical protein D3C81_1655430 [compost metagenome]